MGYITFSGTEELGKLISKNVTPILVAKYYIMLDQGQVVPFGPISCQSGARHSNQRRLLWLECDRGDL